VAVFVRVLLRVGVLVGVAVAVFVLVEVTVFVLVEVTVAVCVGAATNHLAYSMTLSEVLGRYGNVNVLPPSLADQPKKV
jgi:hypothetical protein